MAVAVVDEIALREPRLLIPGRQPLGPVKLDPTHTLFPYIKEALIAVPGGLWDLVRNKFAVTAGTLVSTLAGHYFAPSGAGTYSSNYDLDNVYSPGVADAATLIQHVHISATNYADNFWVGGGASNGLGFRAISGTTAYWIVTDQAATWSNQAASELKACSRVTSPNAKCFVDGVQKASLTSVRTFWTAYPLMWDAMTDGGCYFVVFMPGIDVGDMTAADLSRDPYQLVIPA